MALRNDKSKRAFDSKAGFDGRVSVVLYISSDNISQMLLPLHPDLS